MKKYFSIFLLVIGVVCLSACTKKQELYVINVGDYISDELVSKFEKQYNCTVVYEEKGNNEEIYQRMLNNSYDVVIAADYMIDRLRQEDKIIPLDLTQIPNYSYTSYFTDAQNLIDTQYGKTKDYFISYFWGTFGIMYRSDVSGLKEYIEANDIKAAYLESSYRKGMYNSSRYSISIGLMANGYSANSFDKSELEVVKDQMINAKFDKWGDDQLKQLVAGNQLDMALVFSGDYIDQYNVSTLNGDDIKYSYYNPDTTVTWIDGMTIPKNASNIDLAYKFINFFEDTTNMYENAVYIGYAPLVESVYNQLFLDNVFNGIISKEDFYPYSAKRQMITYVSQDHYKYLNDMMEEIKNAK